MEMFMKDNSKMVIGRGKANILGLMEVIMKDNGSVIR
jgi:hypothetical protein